MISIKKISAEETWDLRWKVMWPDKGREYVKLEEDGRGVHYGLFEEEKLISVVSLFVQDHKAQFRKFATLEDKQGKGYGTKLLTFVIEDAKKMGIQFIWCNARKNKTSFYRKFGLMENKKEFMKDGVEYVTMGKRLEVN